MTERIGEGYTFNPETQRIEKSSRKVVSRGVRITLNHYAIGVLEDTTPGSSMSVPDFFRSARCANLPSVQEAREIFTDFPGDSDACFENSERLQKPGYLSPDELFNITQRAVWGFQRRGEYIDALDGINNEVQKAKAEENRRRYYLATEETAKETAGRWEKVRNDLERTLEAATDGFGGEVKDVAEVIKNATLATVNLQENFQSAEAQLGIIRKGIELRSKLSSLEHKRSQLTKENPTNGKSEPILTEEGFELMVRSYPGAQDADAKEQGRLVAELMEGLNLEIESQKDRVQFLDPQVEMARIGVGTNFRAIRGNLNRLSVAIKSVEGKVPDDLISEMQQKAESALQKIAEADEQAAARRRQPEYSEQHLDAARAAAIAAKDLTKILAGYMQVSAKGMGSTVLVALLESDRQASQIITDQVSVNERAANRYALDVIKNGDFANKTSQRLTELRATLSIIQREAVQNMTDVEATRQRVDFIRGEVERAEELEHLLEEHSKDGDAGYRDYFQNNFWPAILKKFADEALEAEMDLTEDAAERLVAMPVMYMSGDAWRRLTTTLEEKREVASQIAAHYRERLAAATGEHHEALRVSREFLAENIAIGFKDIKKIVSAIEQRRKESSPDYTSDTDEPHTSKEENIDAELELILAEGNR